MNSHRLSNAAAEVMPDERGIMNSECVHEQDEPLRVTTKREIGRSGSVTSSESKQVNHDDSMSFRQQRSEFAPDVSRRRKAVYQDHGLAGSSCSRSVVVEADAADIYEFAAHACRVKLPGWGLVARKPKKNAWSRLPQQHLRCVP